MDRWDPYQFLNRVVITPINGLMNGFFTPIFCESDGPLLITGCWLFELTSKGNLMGWGCVLPEVVERVGQVGGTRTLHRISLGHPDRGVES